MLAMLITSVGCQGDVVIGLENAGAYLGDSFGPLMRVIWAVGLLAAGMYHNP